MESVVKSCERKGVAKRVVRKEKLLKAVRRV